MDNDQKMKLDKRIIVEFSIVLITFLVYVYVFGLFFYTKSYTNNTYINMLTILTQWIYLIISDIFTAIYHLYFTLIHTNHSNIRRIECRRTDLMVILSYIVYIMNCIAMGSAKDFIEFMEVNNKTTRWIYLNIILSIFGLIMIRKDLRRISRLKSSFKNRFKDNK